MMELIKANFLKWSSSEIFLNFISSQYIVNSQANEVMEGWIITPWKLCEIDISFSSQSLEVYTFDRLSLTRHFI